MDWSDQLRAIAWACGELDGASLSLLQGIDANEVMLGATGDGGDDLGSPDNSRSRTLLAYPQTPW